MLYLLNKDSYISPEAFGKLIYDNFIFDVPKMMDLSILFGPTNSVLLSRMFKNIFTNQPKYKFDLEETAKGLTKVHHIYFYSVPPQNVTIHVAFCQVFQLVLGELGLDSSQAAGSVNYGSLSTEEIDELVTYILDISATLWYFVDIYPEATLILIKANIQNQYALISFPCFYRNSV